MGSGLARASGRRSEEHTSNSSHTIISYAVFCLKKTLMVQAFDGNNGARTPHTPASTSCAATHVARERGPRRRPLAKGRRRGPRCRYFFLKQRGPPKIPPLPLHPRLPA